NDPGGSSGFVAGADGMAFLVRNSDGADVGPGGCSMGYNGFPRTLAVELDTFENSSICGFGDPNGNHISFHVNSSDQPGANSASETFSIANTGPPLDVNLKDGAPHDVEVRYAGGMLSAYVDDMDNAKLASPVDLGAALALTDGTAEVGFTSGTAASW